MLSGLGYNLNPILQQADVRISPVVKGWGTAPRGGGTGPWGRTPVEWNISSVAPQSAWRLLAEQLAYSRSSLKSGSSVATTASTIDYTTDVVAHSSMRCFCFLLQTFRSVVAVLAIRPDSVKKHPGATVWIYFPSSVFNNQPSAMLNECPGQNVLSVEYVMSPKDDVIRLAHGHGLH